MSCWLLPNPKPHLSFGMIGESTNIPHPSSRMSGSAFALPSPLTGLPPCPNPTNPNHHQPPPAKKKRNLPGTPDPDAEVIALSPKSLMATNRFVCEVCGKGFQREQNLQLHRRGHNLPWRLRQRAPGGDARRPKRVYVCPEPGCVHHHPSRALGDLTGIKKHFSRKHGEKTWKCDRCSKRYAVRSDWKAHSKTCGTRQYTCDCGTVFSRKDSFITHRAFCDALTQETVAMVSDSSAAGLDQQQYDHLDAPALQPAAAHMSATALLQRAAQVGATMSSPSSSLFFGGLMSSAAAAKGEAGGEGRAFRQAENAGFRNVMMMGREFPTTVGMGFGGMTRDFLGVGGEDDGFGVSRSFLQQEMARFAAMRSAMEFGLVDMAGDHKL